MADKKKARDTQDVFDKALDDPDEYDRQEWESRKAEDALKRERARRLYNTPEGKARVKDSAEGALVGAGLWTAQRLLRRGFRNAPKAFTGAGAITLPASAFVGGTANAYSGIAERKKRRK